jgi:hypothetical protein
MQGATMELSLDESRIKQLFKEALIEVIEERSSVFHELLTEAIEDTALVHAIRDGEDSTPVSKQEVLKLLDNDPA